MERYRVDPVEKRLIESFFPSRAISDQGSNERYQRGKTPHTVFTWWARRPFSAMRAVVASSLAQTVNQNTIQKLEDLITNEGEQENQLLSELVNASNQRVLDMFAGGGTIPLEAAGLGAEVFSLDNNELAHFIQTALLRLSQVGADLPSLVEERGQVLLEVLKRETMDYFPQREFQQKEKTIAYFWSRSTKCPYCDASLSLLKRPWFSQKKDKTIYLHREPDYTTRSYTKDVYTSGEPSDRDNAWDGNVIKCPFCAGVIGRDEIDHVLAKYGFDELTAICTSPGRGKSFIVARDQNAFVPSSEWLWSQIQSDLQLMASELPEVELPRWSGITNPTLYGIHRISDLFNLRQLAVIIRCCRLLNQEYHSLLQLYTSDVARATTAFLSGFVDQLVDWNGRLCMWISQNEQVGRGYSGPGIPMMWDFVEIDPLGNGPANLWDKLDRIISGLKSIPHFEQLPEVVCGDARELPFPDHYFDVVVTDPPYFDNLYYNILADCIFVWKKLAIGQAFPEIFSASYTDQSRELSVCKYRHKTFSEANQFYTLGMTQALSEAARVLKNNGVVALVFAHSSIDGWASIVDSFKNSGLTITAIWNMEVERKHRPRGVRSNAINTSFILVGKRSSTNPEIVWQNLSEILVAELGLQYSKLADGDESAESMALSLFGNAVCICARYTQVWDADLALSTSDLITRSAQIIGQFVPAMTFSKR